MTIEDYKNIAETIQSLFTTVAILVAALWTYFLFIKNRSIYPIVELELSYDKFNIVDDKTMIHAAVKISNNGAVLLNAGEAELRLRQVSPMPEEVEDEIKKGFDPVSKTETEVLWPMIAGRTWKSESDFIEIEPGESDVLHADFAFDKDVEIIEFYFYLKNRSKIKKQLGWALTKIIDLSTKEKKDE